LQQFSDAVLGDHVVDPSKGKGKGKGKGTGKGKGKGKCKRKRKRKVKGSLMGKRNGLQGRSRVALEIVARALCSHCSLAAGVKMAAVGTHSQNALGRSALALNPGVQGRSRVALEIVSRTLRARCFLAAGANLNACC
jgi:hypothetical protein